MARPKDRRVAQLLTTDPDLCAAGVFEFCAAAYPNAALNSGIKELVLRGMTTDPMEATIIGARRAAFLVVIAAMRDVIADAFTMAADQFRAEAMIARANYQAAIDEAVAVELRKRGIEP
jgi:hypothetical protein